MKNFTLTSLLLLLLSFGTQAQSFEEISGPTEDYWFSSSAIVDIDNDGDMDIIISGAVDTTTGGPDTSIAKVYINEDGTFTESTSFIIAHPLHIGDMKLFDMNNDGLLDLVMTGLSYDDIVNYKLYVYINSGSSFDLVEEDPGKIFGSIDYGDFNNNGNLDFITNGTQYIEGTGFVNKIDIFKNMESSFEKSLLISDGTQNGNLKLVDFNNDNLLDIIQIGNDDNYDILFNIYKNTGDGQLEEVVNFGNIGSGNIAIADFNADGLLDIVAQGSDENYDPVLKVYFNEGDFVFTELDLTSEATSNSNGAKTIAIGDLNSDGYNDFITIGEDNDYNGFTKIFNFNPTDETFNVVTESTGLIGIGGSGYIVLEDVNADSQLDILVSGFSDVNGDYTGVTKLYKNLSTAVNEKPEPPTFLEMEVIDNQLLFTWDGATDDKTPTLGLQYELRVGTTEGGAEIAKYKVNTPSWMLQLDELPETIYWAVKSIDASKLYSDESQEKEESTLSTSEFNLQKIAIYPNPATNSFSVEGSDIINIEIYSQDGKQLINTNESTNIDISNIKQGLYIVNIKTTTGQVSKKLIIK